MDTMLIKNADVIDGTGKPAYRADVAVEGNTISQVGPLSHQAARRVIDAEGLVVTPGFIDMHCHTDLSLPIVPTADSLVHQGITTAVTGQCGFSPAPLSGENREGIIASLGVLLEGLETAVPWDEWSSFGEYLAFLERLGISLNIAPLVGQGMIRAGVMGFAAGNADQVQMARMQADTIKALDEGALGLSTGLIYPPGSYAKTGELIELTRAVGERRGFYFSHIRGEAESLLEAVSEAIEIGRKSGAAVQISHFKASGKENWSKSGEALDMIDRARAEGLDVYADMYPYTAGSTGLVAFLPEWAQEGGKEQTLKRLGDPSQREKMKRDMETGGFSTGIDWDMVLINGSARKPAYQGHFVSELAEKAGKTGEDWAFDALRETGLKITMATFSMSEENRRQEMQHPAMTFGTDGFGMALEGDSAGGLPHPRSFGAFPRILGRYVRGEGVLTLEGAVHKMTGLAARRLRLEDRGLIQPGLAADLVLFDPETISDSATYENPHQLPTGLAHVLVNGELVIEDGRHTGARPGLVLKKA